MKSLRYWKFSHFAYKSPCNTAQLKLLTNLHMDGNQPIQTAIVATGSSSWNTAKTFRSGTSKWHPSQSRRCGSTMAEYVDVDYRHLKSQTEHCVSGAAHKSQPPARLASGHFCNKMHHKSQPPARLASGQFRKRVHDKPQSPQEKPQSPKVVRISCGKITCRTRSSTSKKRAPGCATKGFMEFPLGKITLDEFMNINPDQQHNVTSLQAYFSRLGRPRFACECIAIEYVAQLRQRPWRLAAKN